MNEANKIPAPPADFCETPCKWCRKLGGGPRCSMGVCERCWRERAERNAKTQTDLVTVVF